MTDWMRGYYARSGYSYGFYPETMPVHLRWAAMLHRHVLPESRFRYLDAGCGQGLNLILAAALHPDAEFVGIDYMPEHVAHARRLAERCGLDNVTLIEGDFTELADDPAGLGAFDMVVCHGIATWIAADVRRALYRMVGQVLRPGGVFYNGYNCQPGWLSVMPFQQLVKLEMRTGDGIAALNGARRKIEQLGEASEPLFRTYPELSARLEGLDRFSPSYLTQEYNHEHWQPAFVSDVIAELEAVKLNFLGPATLFDCFDNLLRPGVRELLRQQTDVTMREQMRDFATLQNFRRDLYVKGRPSAWDVELSETLRATRVIVNPLVPRPPAGEPFTVAGGTTELSGNHASYAGLLDRIESLGDAAAIGQLIDGDADPRREATLVEMLSMLIQGRWVTPLIPAPNPRGPEIAAAIAREVCLGAPYRHVPVPVTGGVVQLNETDIILIGLLDEGVPRERMALRLLAVLDRLQRRLAKDGKAMTDPAEQGLAAAVIIDEFFEGKLPYLRKTGVVRG